MNEMTTQLAVVSLHEDVIKVLKTNIVQGVKNLPEPIKVMLASDSAGKVLDDIAETIEKKEDFDKPELISLAACYFTMAMAEEVLDEFEKDDPEQKDK
jgi:hypothetical protein